MPSTLGTPGSPQRSGQNQVYVLTHASFGIVAQKQSPPDTGGDCFSGNYLYMSLYVPRVMFCLA